MQSDSTPAADTSQHKRLNEIRPVLEGLLCRLQERFASELVSVVLYGSYARDQADVGSDIDLMVVVQDLPQDWHEIFALEDNLSDMGKDFGRRLDIRLVEPQA